MKKIIIVIILVIILAVVGVIYLVKSSKTTSQTSTKTNTGPMTITSPAFAEGAAMPKKYSCDAEGVNPPLDFKGVPDNAQSLALLVDDPDVANGTWTHWVIWDISPSTTSIKENSVPEKAIQGQASSGKNVFGAFCPPSGMHHYHFKLFALDTKLSTSIPPYSDVTAFTHAINGHVISSAELVGIYSRGQ